MNNQGEQRYTLEEARHELAVRECRAYGHQWTVQVTDTLAEIGRPYAIMCDRCCTTIRLDTGQLHEAITALAERWEQDLWPGRMQAIRELRELLDEHDGR